MHIRSGQPIVSGRPSSKTCLSSAGTTALTIIFPQGALTIGDNRPPLILLDLDKPGYAGAKDEKEEVAMVLLHMVLLMLLLLHLKLSNQSKQL